MVISFAKQKGGTGTTTTAVSLATLLSKLGKSVLFIDLDPQASATDFFLKFDEQNENNLLLDQIVYQGLIGDNELPIIGVAGGNIDLAPASILLSDIEIDFVYQSDSIDDHRSKRLKRQVDKIKTQYDYVIIDCPGSLGMLTLNALCASDHVILVSSIGKFERNSTRHALKKIERWQAEYNPSLNIMGILLTMTDPFKITDVTLKKLNSVPEIESKLFKSSIPKNNAIRNATDEDISIFTYSPFSPSAKAYIKLWDEMKTRMGV